ncbi:MAG: family 43 glycosylhydrolase, partial [Lachnospiraceae bacterium]|nr:family 43 glycosylhydrolase [Lachnospiraceae bacterium]
MKNLTKALNAKVVSILLAVAMVVTSIAVPGNAKADTDATAPAILDTGVHVDVFAEPLAPVGVRAQGGSAAEWVLDEHYKVGEGVREKIDGGVGDFYRKFVGNDQGCSARYTSRIYVPETKAYNFWMYGDDGFRLYVDGEKLIDWWVTDWDKMQRSTKSIELTEGYHDLVVEHLQGFGGVHVSLRWNGENEVIPAANYFHDVSNTTIELKKGDTYTLKSESADATWRSTDETVATVDNGTITAVKGGSADIELTVAGVTSKVTVNVKDGGVATTIYEAENAALTSPAAVASNGGAHGGKKVGWIDNTSAKIDFTVNVESAGTYNIGVFADGEANAVHTYKVNGGEAQTVTYTKSHGWDNWEEYPIAVQLNAGDNHIVFSNANDGGPYAELDYIQVYPKDFDINEKFAPILGGIKVGDKAIEGFDGSKYFYEMPKAASATYPEVSAVDVKAGYTATVTQASDKLPQATITITNNDDPEDIVSYGVNFYDPENSFTSSIVNFGADPFVTYEDGYYYYIRVLKDTQIYISKSPQIYRLAAVEPVKVVDVGGNGAEQLWAPEVHYIDGKWYIYVCMGGGGSHRLYVYESETSDAQGKYKDKVKLTPKAENNSGLTNVSAPDANDFWGIDQTVFKYKGKLYGVWSGWSGDRDYRQSLWIAEMDSPTSFSSERHLISTPMYSWETDQTPVVNEGPQVVYGKDKDGEEIINIVYSASGSWADTYCLGMVSLQPNKNPLDIDSWTKAKKPIFTQNRDTTFSTGHASFVKLNENGGYLVYHATRGSGQGWSGRGARVQQFAFHEDGTPYLGVACNYDSKVNIIDGSAKPTAVRYEAEDAVLSSCSAVSTYNSSNGEKVSFTAREGVASFEEVNVEKAGYYTVFLGACFFDGNYTQTSDLDIVVNGKDAGTVKVLPFDSDNGNASVVTDNWNGYGVTAYLNKGNNVIEVQKNTTKARTGLDYIEIDLVKELDKAPLEKAIADAKALNKTDYTPATYAAIEKAVADAEALLAKDEENAQADLDAALAAINAAVKGLAKPEYKINYVLNGGVNAKANPAMIPATGIKSLAAPTRAKYVFGGWYADKAFKTKVTSVAAGKEATVYAKWTAAAAKKGAVSKATNVKGKKISVKIKKIAGANKYSVQVSNSKKFKKIVKKATTTKTTVTIKGLKKGTYYVRVAMMQKDSTGKMITGKYGTAKKVKV